MKGTFGKIKLAISRVCANIFTLLMMYSVFIGAVTFVMFIVGFILGGSNGEMLAVNAAAFVKTGIPVSAAAGLFGLISMYIADDHALLVGASKKKDAEDDKD